MLMEVRMDSLNGGSDPFNKDLGSVDIDTKNDAGPYDTTQSDDTTGKGQAAHDSVPPRRLRNLPGTKDECLYQWPHRSLDQIESAFASREYLQSLIRLDPHNVDGLLQLPQNQDERTWLYEHLCQVCLELNFLIVQLVPECTPEVCPEMRAEEWMYYCAAHSPPRECCAIDYLTHTLDGASALLNNLKHFPSRTYIPDGSVKNFQSIARRLYRIFAHAYFHHRDIFEAFEAESSLYHRFLKLCRTRNLMTDKLLIIPDSSVLSKEDVSPQLDPRTIMTRTRRDS